MTPQVGMKFKEFTVLEQLRDRGPISTFRGRGGSANEVVFLRSLELRHMSAVTRDGFERSMQDIARLRSPHLLLPLTWSKEDDCIVIVTPFVPGGSVRTLIDEQRRSGEPIYLRQALQIMRSVAIGLDYLHKQSVIARGMKPENILGVSSSIEAPLTTVQLCDFYLHKLLTQPVDDSVVLNHSIGTLRYLSPEECALIPADHRSDIYSFGLILFELVTGQHPFQIGDAQDAMFKHINNVPEPLRQHRRDAPEALEKLVTRCLSKNPGERFGAADLLVGELDALLSSLPAESAQGFKKPAPSKPNVQTQQPAHSRPIWTVRAYDADERFITEHELSTQPLTVGRAQNCQILLPDPEKRLSRQHLLIELKGERVFVKQFPSPSPSLLGKIEMQPDDQLLWTPGNPLLVGTYRLNLLVQGLAPSIPVPPDDATVEHHIRPASDKGSPVPIPRSPVPHLSSPHVSIYPPKATTAEVLRHIVSIKVQQKEHTIQWDQDALFVVELVNLSKNVVHCAIKVTGVPSSWVSLEPREVELMVSTTDAPNPKSKQPITVKIHPPAKPESRAGEHPLHFQVIDLRAQMEVVSSTDTAKLIIRPQPSILFKMLTPQLRAWHKGTALIEIENAGNISEEVRLAAQCPNDRLMLFEFSQDKTDLEPGGKYQVSMDVATDFHLFGESLQKEILLTRTMNGTQASSDHKITFVHRPVIHRWLLPVLLFLLALFVMWYKFRPAEPPVVTHFTVSPREVLGVEGAVVTLQWATSDATTVKIEGTKDEQPPTGSFVLPVATPEHNSEPVMSFSITAIGKGGSSLPVHDEITVKRPVCTLLPGHPPIPVRTGPDMGSTIINETIAPGETFLARHRFSDTWLEVNGRDGLGSRGWIPISPGAIDCKFKLKELPLGSMEPEIGYFRASREEVQPGARVTFSWSVANARRLNFDGEKVEHSDSRQRVITAEREFVLTVWDSNEQKTEYKRVVKVKEPEEGDSAPAPAASAQTQSPEKAANTPAAAPPLEQEAVDPDHVNATFHMNTGESRIYLWPQKSELTTALPVKASFDWSGTGRKLAVAFEDPLKNKAQTQQRTVESELKLENSQSFGRNEIKAMNELCLTLSPRESVRGQSDGNFRIELPTSSGCKAFEGKFLVYPDTATAIFLLPIRGPGKLTVLADWIGLSQLLELRVQSASKQPLPPFKLENKKPLVIPLTKDIMQDGCGLVVSLRIDAVPQGLVRSVLGFVTRETIDGQINFDFR